MDNNLDQMIKKQINEFKFHCVQFNKNINSYKTHVINKLQSLINIDTSQSQIILITDMCKQIITQVSKGYQQLDFDLQYTNPHRTWYRPGPPLVTPDASFNNKEGPPNVDGSNE